MEELYRLRRFMKEKHCTLLESFQTYKDDDKFKNTDLFPDEFLKVLNSIGFKIAESSLYKCLECFETTSQGKVDYINFCKSVEYAINPRTKGLKNLRKFKDEEEIYAYLADQ